MRNFRKVAPEPERWKCAEGFKEMPSFTAKSWWVDHSSQGDGENYPGKSTGRIAKSTPAAIPEPSPEYDLSRMSPDEVAAMEKKLGVQRPVLANGKQADGITHVDWVADTEGQPKGNVVQVKASVKATNVFRVYWEDPNGESAAGDGTLRDHEMRHVRAIRAVETVINRQLAAHPIIPLSAYDNYGQYWVDLTRRVSSDLNQRIDSY